MATVAQHIPEVLIYEMIDGTPVYYRGYQDYLKGNKPLAELMGSSYLQAHLITQLVILLGERLSREKYRVIAHEIGLRFDKKSWRAADIAVFERDKLREIPLENKYLELAPELVVEVDTKAEVRDVINPLGYYQEKTDQLLNFGVRRVVWIFTETQKVMIADQGKDWVTINWTKPFLLFQEIEVNITDLLDR